MNTSSPEIRITPPEPPCFDEGDFVLWHYDLAPHAAVFLRYADAELKNAVIKCLSREYIVSLDSLTERGR